MIRLNKTKLAVIFGGPSHEHEVSIMSASEALKHIDRIKYKVDLVKIHKDETWQFLPYKRRLSLGSAIGQLLKNRYHLVILLLHGSFGEDGRIQALLDSVKVPYTGSGMTSSAVAMDKYLSNQLYALRGFNVPAFNVYTDIPKHLKNIKLPVVIKPIEGGSSVGTYIVKRFSEMKRAFIQSFKVTDRVMVQRYIKGREFTCGVLEKDHKPFSLVPTEIIPKSKFFDYKAKYRIGGSQEITPPNLPKAKIVELQNLALSAHILLGCRGMSRTDFILKGSKFYILETNTIPGLTQTSLLPQGAAAAGIDYKQMLELIISSAHAKIHSLH